MLLQYKANAVPQFTVKPIQVHLLIYVSARDFSIWESLQEFQERFNKLICRAFHTLEEREWNFEKVGYAGELLHQL